jgi:hypothetical protein
VTCPAKKPGAAASGGAVVVVVLVGAGGGTVVVEDGGALVVLLGTEVVVEEAPGDAKPPLCEMATTANGRVGAEFLEADATAAAATAPAVRSKQRVNGTIRADFRVGVAPDAMAAIVASRGDRTFVTPALKD